MSCCANDDLPAGVICPAGPLLIRGDHVITDRDGVEHATTRPVTAVCRCGASAIGPWCDGTHKVIPERLRPA